MKFILVEKIIDTGQVLEEPYEITTDDPVLWCKNILESFNKSLLPGESPREFVDCKIINTDNFTHQWRKASLTTRSDKDGPYDVYICDKCGITGKRRKLDTGVTRDKKFRFKKYADCSWNSGQDARPK